MTMRSDELVGAQVTGGDGKVVGTVEQVFRDDVDGTPTWARVRAGKTGRFVPLGSSQVTADGLRVPFDAEKIIGGPNVDVGQHLSAAQAEELGRYYGLMVPAQSRQPTGEEWLVRQEERLMVSKELAERGRIRLRKYVDVEPVEHTVHVFREEYDVERTPISTDERIGGNIEEGVLEIILHEERPVLHTETVPVERVRLVPRRIEEDKTYQFEVRRERIEIEPDPQIAGSELGGSQDYR